MDRSDAPALLSAMGASELQTLTCAPRERSRQLVAVPLLLVRAEGELLSPEASVVLRAADHVLFAGTQQARARQQPTLRNANALEYVRPGRDAPGGRIWQWLNQRQAA